MKKTLAVKTSHAYVRFNIIELSVLGELMYGIECHPKHKKTAVNNKKSFAAATLRFDPWSDCSTV